MPVSFDPLKRDIALAQRGLDFANAEIVFAGATLTRIDDRSDYGEVCMQTYGRIDGRMVMVV